MKRVPRTATITMALVGLIAGSAAWYLARGSGQDVSFRTVPVKRGNLVATISATGTLEPDEVVDVGAQVAGQIVRFGEDADGKTIDYGSHVDEGTILARIDDSLYAADAAQAAAQVEQAKAGVTRAKADLEQFKAKLDEADAQWQRAQKLQSSSALADIEYITYRSAYDVAKANVGVGEASVVQAEKAVLQAEATLRRAQRNLGYCTIRSPVKGVIIDRRVNIGQTVVSSLNAPSLFLIAKDLARIQVWVSVNEADIGNIHPGQPAAFTVDAFPGQVFHGTVNKVRLNATMTQNVVTYTVEVTTDNADGKLLPYLTANVQFEEGRRDNVLLAPSVALRWMPPGQQIAPEARQVVAGAPAARSQEAGTPGPGGPAEPGQTRGTLWTPQGRFVRPIAVRVGMTDGSMTEVSGKDLHEGISIVVSEQLPEAGGKPGGTNPFTPQLGRARSNAAQQQRP